MWRQPKRDLSHHQKSKPEVNASGFFVSAQRKSL
nr:MAG TPA: hypothetical protein [Caudoviricetes sp.]